MEPLKDEYRVEPMGKEEGQKLTDELQEVLAKHNAEMGVTSTIQLLKRVKIDPKEESTPSPYPTDGNEGEEKEPAEVD